MSSDTTTVAPGVRRRECGWGYYLEGTKAALFAAGLAKQDWFADGTESAGRGRIVRSKSFTENGREIKTHAPKIGPYCSVCISYTAAEIAKAERERDDAERRKLMQPEALRQHVEDKHFFGAMTGIMRAFNLTDDHEWSFSPEVCKKANDICIELMGLFRHSEIIPRNGAHIEGDAEFQRFMQSTLIGCGNLDGDRTQH